MAFNTVTTERLIVRAPRPDDLADFLAYRNDPDNLRLQPVEPIGEAAALAFLQRQATLDIDAGPCWMMCALELKDSGAMIGEVGIFLAPAPASVGNIGWSIQRKFQGQGFAVEAARALLDFVFFERQLHRVTANSDARNVASTRVMESLGMRREGVMRKSQLLKGEWQDEYLYAILREEWPVRQTASARHRDRQS